MDIVLADTALALATTPGLYEKRYTADEPFFSEQLPALTTRCFAGCCSRSN